MKWLKINRTNTPDLLTTIILPLIIISFYWPVTDFAFLNLDDPIYVYANPEVMHGVNWQSLTWAFTTSTLGHWHPLTWLSHMLDCHLFGLDAGWHHLVNLIWFSAAAVILFWLLLSLHFSTTLALFGTLIFTLHPLRLESVVWISERKDMLSLCFGLATLLIYQHYRKTKRQHTLVLAMFSYLLSLLAKPTFVSLPLLLLLFDCSAAAVKRILPFALLALSSSLLVLKTQAAVGALKTITLDARIATAITSYMAFGMKFIWPFNNAIFYPQHTPLTSHLIFAAAILLVLTLFFYQRRGIDKDNWLGWLWFLIAAAPLCGFVYIGGQAYADRWTLLPHLGLIWLVLASFRRLLPRFPQLFYPGIILIIGLASITWRQLPDWRNSESIFRQALRVTHDNFLAHNNLGAALAEQNRFEEAFAHYEAAVRINPSYAEAVNNLGIARIHQNNLPAAIALFKQAMALDENLTAAKQNLILALRRQKK